MRVLGQVKTDMRREHQRLVRRGPAIAQSTVRGRASEVGRQLAAMLAARTATYPAAPGFAGGLAATTTASSVIATGWDAIDRALAPALPHDLGSDALARVGRGGLARGSVHEWLCGDAMVDRTPRVRRWLPPHGLFVHLAWRAIEASDEADSSGLVIWIGRRVWPQALSLWRVTAESTEITEQANGSCMDRRAPGPRSVCERLRTRKASGNGPPISFSRANSFQVGHRLLNQSVFIDPPNDASRVWAIDLALRSRATSVVIADGSKLKMAESRRLQLAAERGRALALLARPAGEGAELSAAATRWRVRRARSPSASPRWVIELLRCRHGTALQASRSHGSVNDGTGGWEMEYVSPGCLRLVADVVDRSGSSGATAALERTG